MKESIIKIQKYTKNMTFDQFEDSSLIVDATLRNLGDGRSRWKSR
jgi:uncharacterized protein with HEPN domain